MELWIIDIITVVSMLASQLALPREVHLEALFQIFGYLMGYHNSQMVFGLTYPTPDMSIFRSMIGVIFMVTWRRRLLPTHLS